MAPLAVDHVYASGGAAAAAEEAGAPMVVLCAPLGSAAFREAHAVLAERARATAIVYAYRPLVNPSRVVLALDVDRPGALRLTWAHVSTAWLWESDTPLAWSASLATSPTRHGF